MTVTLHAWWLVFYLLIGIVTWFPFNVWAYRRVPDRGRYFSSTWTWLASIVRRDGWASFALGVLVQVVAWPAAICEAVR